MDIVGCNQVDDRAASFVLAPTTEATELTDSGKHKQDISIEVRERESCVEAQQLKCCTRRRFVDHRGQPCVRGEKIASPVASREPQSCPSDHSSDRGFEATACTRVGLSTCRFLGFVDADVIEKVDFVIH
ncbi:hypothetical protein U2G91_26495 (plasmid) [Rhodococcoides fascians]|uniref:hypothetical protein n=1 Tax=Rhodococcoides fascians TaxID=1828 RepID=UPI002ACDCCC6|nr:hypothetical protein [Rhodococcus fascians]WQH31358.1 hypothetical protein U2G91_26495 [Rhodococcus fascians]